MKKHFLSAIAAIFCSTTLFAQLNFTMNPNSGCAPLGVTFTNTSTDPDAYRFDWYFGDGSPVFVTTMMLNETTAHTYTVAGYYYPYVNVFDVAGNYIGYTYGSSGYVQVNGLGGISALDIVCPIDMTDFCPNIVGNYTTVSWNFGDGNNSTLDCDQHSYSILNTYTVTVTANTECGVQSVSKPIVVDNSVQPDVNFWISPANNICPNQPITFSTIPLATYSWNFGDGNTSTQANPSHSYTTVGTYTATLTGANGCGNQGIYTDFITITTTAGFPGTSIYNGSGDVCPTQQAYLYSTGGPFQKYVWNFGDGSPLDSSGSYVYHAYSAVGTKIVTCTITNYCGEESVFITTMNVATYVPFPNNITLNINPNPSCPGDIVVLNAPGGFQNYQYNFGDGSPNASGIYSSWEHVYALGTYTAFVTVTNICGNDTILYATVNVTNNAGLANLYMNVSNPTPCPGEPVYFDASYGYPKYVWNYGDGSPADSSVGNYPSHSYTTTGIYTVSVTITNNCGQDTTLSVPLTISNSTTIPTGLSISTYYTPSCPGQSIQFYAPGGSFTSYKWNAGDGFIDSVSNSYYLYHSYAIAGTYTVSLILTNYCGNKDTLYSTVVIDATLGFPTSNFNLEINPPSACPGQSVNMWAPYGYASYVWNFGDGITDSITYSSVNHSYFSVGTYSVSVKIYNHCGKDTTLYGTVTIGNNIGFTEQLYFDVNPSPACPMDAVSFNANGGYASYFYNFGDGNTAVGNSYTDYTYTAVSTYTVSVTITNQCGIDTTLSSTVVIDSSGIFPSWISISANPSSSCPGDIVNFEVQGSYQSYLWFFGDGDTLFTTSKDNIQHTYTATGVYPVSCIITNGCGKTKTFFATVQVTTNSPIGDVSIEALNAPACPGDNVIILVSSGASTYTYYWNYGDGILDTTIGGNGTHLYASVGNYTVTMTAINGCGNSKTVTANVSIIDNAYPILVLPDGEPLFGTPGGDNGNVSAGCPGDAILFYFIGDTANNVWNFGDGNTGTATQQMVIAGGNGSVPVTFINHAYAVSGTYTVTLTLTNNCGNSTTDTITITIGDNLLVNGELVTSPPPFTSCASIDFIAFGGQTYQYNFGDGSPVITTTSPALSHLFPTAGVYVVTCLITNGCGNTATYYQTVNVISGGGPSVSVSSNISPTCVGGGNGSADVLASNGTAPYSYLWNDASAQITSLATGLVAGTYAVTVTDNVECASIQYLTVNDPAPIVLSASTTQATCGQSDGTASISVSSGGTSPYSYSWSNGQTTSTATEFGWGSYAATITDANGCTSTTNASISEIGTATVTVNAVTNATCYSDSNGVIDINISGGNPPFVYTWSNGGTTQDISGLSAGNYSVMITDAGSCNATLNTTVGQGKQIMISTSAVVSPTCGNFDGSASASATGGNSPYSYLWTNAGNQTTQTATGLPAGTFSVQVTDASGCTSVSAISLSNSNAPNVTSVVTDVNCNGNANGTIDITVTGGTSPYLYTWNVGPPQTNNQNLNSLAPGSYIVIINDAAGCLSVRSYTITQPAVLTASVTNTGATCGNNDGSATAIPTGGNISYSYLWTGGQTTQTAVNLALGSKTVTVTDSEGCTTSATTTITTTTNMQNICVVTVDSTSTKNVIWWEKPTNAPIDSFRIYRDISSVFTYVGSTSYNELSTFTDSTVGVDPNLTSYRYKISVLDTCGMESDTSDYHKTMLLQVSPAIPSGYNLDWDDYLGMTATEYKILRDTTGTGNFWQAIDSVGFAITAYTDPIPWDTVSYVIETDHPTGCTATLKNPLPMGSNLNSSRSNTYRTGDSTAVSVNNISNEFSVNIFPNPSNGMFTLDLKNNNSGSAIIKVYKVLGEKVYEEALTLKGTDNRNTISLPSGSGQGVYYLQISTSDNITTKKIIIE